MLKLWKFKVIGLQVLLITLCIIAVPFVLGMVWFGVYFIVVGFGLMCIIVAATILAIPIFEATVFMFFVAIFKHEVFTTIGGMWRWLWDWSSSGSAFLWPHITKTFLPYIAFGIVVILLIKIIEYIPQKIKEIRISKEKLSWDKVFTLAKIMRFLVVFLALYVVTVAVGMRTLMLDHPKYTDLIMSNLLAIYSELNWIVTLACSFFIFYAFILGIKAQSWKGFMLGLLVITYNSIMIFSWWTLSPRNIILGIILLVIAMSMNFVIAKYRTLEPA